MFVAGSAPAPSSARWRTSRGGAARDWQTPFDWHLFWTGGEMKRGKWMARVALVLAMAGMVCPQALLAADPANGKPTVVDVRLLEDGVLLGQVVDSNGKPVPEVPVAVASGQRQLAVGRSDGRGYFAFRGLRGGVYEISAAQGAAAYRLWAPGTAPPTAQPGALVVGGQDLVRGQCGECGQPGPLGRLGYYACARPWIVAGLVATAVAVPVGIHAAQREAPASP
ncbi:MAG TPA: carboxypeptidase regulatory-like domain-containing protein [Planctomycetaceae bacterium]|nr:carboxypeptidase regulatory-like domain-containing protein [Planctomycetaceae bacterium]